MSEFSPAARKYLWKRLHERASPDKEAMCRDIAYDVVEYSCFNGGAEHLRTNIWQISIGVLQALEWFGDEVESEGAEEKEQGEGNNAKHARNVYLGIIINYNRNV